MTRSLLLKLILSVVVCFPAQAFTQSSPDTNSVSVYYFLDASCANCVLKNYNDTKIWIVTTDTYTGNLKDQDEVIKRFQTLISKKYQPDSTLLKQVVFRFQNSNEKIRETYTAMQSKMKERGYLILKVDF
jgi:hypothetical protein